MSSGWPYVIGAIVVIVVALEVAPKIGGALLLLVVLASLARGASLFQSSTQPSGA